MFLYDTKFGRENKVKKLFNYKGFNKLNQQKIINKENKFAVNKKEINKDLYTENWEELFRILLN